jgi:hypothetical protein
MEPSFHDASVLASYESTSNEPGSTAPPTCFPVERDMAWLVANMEDLRTYASDRNPQPDLSPTFEEVYRMIQCTPYTLDHGHLQGWHRKYPEYYATHSHPNGALNHDWTETQLRQSLGCSADELWDVLHDPFLHNMFRICYDKVIIEPACEPLMLDTTREGYVLDMKAGIEIADLVFIRTDRPDDSRYASESYRTWLWRAWFVIRHAAWAYHHPEGPLHGRCTTLGPDSQHECIGRSYSLWQWVRYRHHQFITVAWGDWGYGQIRAGLTALKYCDRPHRFRNFTHMPPEWSCRFFDDFGRDEMVETAQQQGERTELDPEDATGPSWEDMEVMNGWYQTERENELEEERERSW